MTKRDLVLLFILVFGIPVWMVALSVLRGQLCTIVKANPLCTVNDDVSITGTTNISNPLSSWSVTNCTDANFDDIGNTCDFTPAAGYTSVFVAARPDLTSDVVILGFYTGAGGTGSKIGQIETPNSFCTNGLSSWWYQTHVTVMLPTSVRSVKIESAGGCRGGETFNDNIIIMGYIR